MLYYIIALLVHQAFGASVHLFPPLGELQKNADILSVVKHELGISFGQEVPQLVLSTNGFPKRPAVTLLLGISGISENQIPLAPSFSSEKGVCLKSLAELSNTVARFYQQSSVTALFAPSVTLEKSEYLIDLSNRQEAFKSESAKQLLNALSADRNELQFSNTFGVQGFDYNVKWDQEFMDEVLNVNRLLDTVKTINTDKPSVVTIIMAKLVKMAQVYEKEAPEKYQKAIEIVQGLIKKAMNLASNDGSIRFVLVRMSTEESVPRLIKRSIEPDCPQTFQSCMSSNRNCSGNGVCKAQKTNKGTCFFCACELSPTAYAGESCQLKDVSVEFNLFFWTVFGILIALSFSIGMLFQVGEERKQVGSGSSSGHLKSE